MKNRIEALLDKLQLSPSKFADEIGMQRSAMSHILSGRNKPSLEVMQKILNRFPEVNIDWLIQGKGTLFNEDKNTPAPPSKQTEALDKRMYDIPQAKPEKETLSDTSIEQIIEQPIISKVEPSKLEPRPQLALFDMPPVLTKEPVVKRNEVVQTKNVKPALETESENKTAAKVEENADEKVVKSIVVFYSNNTFCVFKPGESLF